MGFTVCIFLFCLSAVEFGVVQSSRDLPSYFPRCFRNDPKSFNECLLKATDTVRPYLRKGVPELNIPSISPFTVPEIILQQGTNSLSYKAVMKDLIITGLDTYNITYSDLNFERQTFLSRIDMGELFLDGELQIEGKILNFPLKGKGRFTAHIKSSKGIMDNDFRIIKRKNGLEYMEFTRVNVKIEVGEILDVKVTGLFQENKDLEEAAKRVFRENLRELIEELKPAVEKVMEEIISNVILKNVNRIPYEKLYPLKV